MNIEQIFSSKERIKILNSIIYLEGKFGVNEVARKVKVSKSLVSKYFEILVKNKILKKTGNKFIVRDNAIVRGIKIMLNIHKINTRIFRRYKFVKAVGLYGSCAKGTNTESSDIDLWIKVEKIDEKKIIELTSKLRKKLKNVKVLILDDKKIEELKRNDPVFYHSLYFGSLMLYGEEGEI